MVGEVSAVGGPVFGWQNELGHGLVVAHLIDDDAGFAQVFHFAARCVGFAGSFARFAARSSSFDGG